MATLLAPGTMAEANIAGTFYVCTVVSGPDNSQMYTVRFSNGATQQVHSSLIRTTPAVGAPAPPAVVVAQPAVAVAASYPAHEKAPLQETPAATAQYPTPTAAAAYPTPAAATAYPTPTATGIYPAIPPPASAAPVIVATAPAPVIVVTAPAPAPVVVAPAANVVVAPAANVAVTTTTTATTKGGPFAENENVEALFRGNWFASKIIKSYGNGKYKVKYLKSKTFGTVTENKIRRKQAVVRKTVVTRTATTTAAGINADVKKASKEVNRSVNSVEKDITSGLNQVGAGIDCFLFGNKKKKKQTTKTVTQKTVTRTAAPPPTQQKFKVVTSTTTKIVNGKKIVTKTTKKIPIGPAPPAPAPQQRFNVVVPAGCVAGQLITIAGPNGKQAQVAIPAGLSAGQTFQVTMS